MLAVGWRQTGPGTPETEKEADKIIMTSRDLSWYLRSVGRVFLDDNLAQRLEFVVGATQSPQLLNVAFLLEQHPEPVLGIPFMIDLA